MNCLKTIENFSAHFEDSLDYQSLKLFEDHMATCLTCQREYDQFCISIKVSQELPQIEPSATFLRTLEQKLVGNERESLTIWERISRLFNITHLNMTRKTLTGAAILLLVAATITFVLHDDLFDPETQSDATVPGITSEKQDTDRNDLFPIETGSEFSSIGVSPLMQQNYTLKQVSYSSVSIGGGL